MGEVPLYGDRSLHARGGRGLALSRFREFRAPIVVLSLPPALHLIAQSSSTFHTLHAAARWSTYESHAPEVSKMWPAEEH